MFSTRYIVDNQLNYQLLTKLNATPTNPLTIFFRSIILFLILAIIINIRQNVSLTQNANNWLIALELGLAIAVYFSLEMSYNGIFLLVFINLFLSNKNNSEFNHYRLWILAGLMLLLLFSISDQNLLNELVHMPDISVYINFWPQGLRSVLFFIRSFIALTNLALFIIILVLYANYLISREQELKNKLLISEEFKSMADLTENFSHDKDRQRLARDIHDTIGHTLTGFAVGLDAAIVLIDINPDAAKKQLKKVSKAVKEGLVNIRKALNRIRPGALDNYTFKSALEKTVQELGAISHLDIYLDYNWDAEKLEKTTEDAIFHIIEETITNSLKHGHATKLTIVCNMNDNNYQMIIHNNGKCTPHFHPGNGLTYLKDLVDNLGGTIVFNGKKGFTTTVEIPKEGNADD